MNDDDLSPELELASAYLDGEVDSVQRAQVESSPELAATVQAYRQIQVALGDVPPADPTARDTAVAAALAEFDVLRAPAAAALVPAPATVVAIPRRTRWSRVAMAAAAVVLVGAIGVTALSGSDDSSSSGEQSAKDATADQAVVAADTAGGGAPQTIGAINAPAEVVPRIDQPEQLLTLAPVEAVPTAGATETTASPPSTLAATGETTADAATTESSTFRTASFVFDCPLSSTQQVLLEISWQGTPAVAVRDTVSGVIQAIDAQCNVLASTAP